MSKPIKYINLDEATNEIFPRELLDLFAEFAGMRYVVGSEYIVEDQTRDTMAMVYLTDESGVRTSLKMYFTLYVYKIARFRKSLAVMEYSHSIGYVNIPRHSLKIIYRVEDVKPMQIYPMRRTETHLQQYYSESVEDRDEIPGILETVAVTVPLVDDSSMDVVKIKLENVDEWILNLSAWTQERLDRTPVLEEVA